MTRRARMGPLQTLNRGVDRMAPGGRRSASESPIRPFYRPVGEMGETPGPGTVLLRPVLVEGFIPASGTGASSSTLTLVGGAGNSTLGDQSDATYARMTSDRFVYVGSVKATFETAAIEFDPLDATLTCRVRASAVTPPPPPATPGELSWALTAHSGSPLYKRSTDFSTPADRWQPTSAWTDMTAAWSGGLPNWSAVAAGVTVYLQAYTYPFGGTAFLQLDVSDVSLLLVGEPWEVKV